MPLIGAMAMRNFTDILALLTKGRQLNATDEARNRVVSRALQKRASFHLNKNSVADALLVELYAEVIKGRATDDERYGFVTSSNRGDFSVQQGNHREPHPDIAGLFDGLRSRYFYRIDGLQEGLADYLGDEFEQMLEELGFQEDPRTLTEILEAEQEFFDRVSFERSVR